MWLLAYARLLTNDARWRRRSAEQLDCYACGGKVENGIHVIHDFLLAAEVFCHSIINIQVFLDGVIGRDQMEHCRGIGQY